MSLLMGTGATAIERALVWATTVAGTLLVVLTAVRADVGWAWWQWVVVVALAVDLVGGVVANSLGSAKLLYHSPRPADSRVIQRLALDPIAFTAIHVQPFAATLLLGDGHQWPWAASLYTAALLGIAAVRAAPRYLARPIGFAAALLTVLLVGLVDAPPALAWLAPVFVLKLVLAHAIPEAPYRPDLHPSP